MSTSDQIVETFTEELKELKVAIRGQGEILGTINTNIVIISEKMKAVESCCTDMQKTQS